MRHLVRSCAAARFWRETQCAHQDNQADDMEEPTTLGACFQGPGVASHHSDAADCSWGFGDGWVGDVLEQVLLSCKCCCAAAPGFLLMVHHVLCVCPSPAARRGLCPYWFLSQPTTTEITTELVCRTQRHVQAAIPASHSFLHALSSNQSSPAQPYDDLANGKRKRTRRLFCSWADREGDEEA